METALSEALHQIKAAIAFLENIKLDKKFRKEKDDLLENLKRTLHKSERYTSSNQVPNGDAKGGNDVYNDVEVAESGDLYNDVSAADMEATYVENDVEEPDVYTDTATMSVGGDTSGDPVHSPSPLQTSPVFPPIPCDQLTDAVIAEFLQMKRERTILSGGWSKRWCVLHHNVLYIYESSKDKKQKDAIDLRGYTLEVREDITREAKRKDRCFELRNDQQKKTYDFCASDRDAMVKWKSSLLKTGVVSKGVDKTTDTVSMKSDNTDTDTLSKPKSLFAGLKSKLTGNSAMQNEVPEIQDDLYNDTEGDASLTYDDTNAMVYDDTENPDAGDTYNDTEVQEEVYDDADTWDGPQQKKDNRPLPSPARSHDSLPPPPITLQSLPPPPSPGLKSPVSRLSTKESPMLPPRSPHGSLPQPPSPVTSLPQPEKSAHSPVETEEDYENMYQGMWDCNADDDTELEFKRGEIVHVISREYDNYGWWVAKKNDVVGLVPRSYLMEAYEM